MIRGLEKIKSDEENEKTKAELASYVKELEWFKNSDNPLKEIEEELAKLINTLRKDMDEEEERALLERIHTLKTKHISIKEERYEADLKRNITACLLRVEQYEASKENRSLLDIIKGIFTNSEETKNYLQRKYMVSLSNAYGIAPSAVNLNLERIEDILEYIARNYDLVGIEIKLEKEETEMIPAEEQDNPIRKKVLEITDNFIEQSVNIEDKDLTEVEKEKIKVKRGKSVNKGPEIQVKPKEEEKEK